jgi:hypothetical protein
VTIAQDLSEKTHVQFAGQMVAVAGGSFGIGLATAKLARRHHNIARAPNIHDRSARPQWIRS